MDSVKGYWLDASGLPHSDISGSKSGCRLPEAFRRLQRPSSPPAAKASTVCAYSLDHIPKQPSRCTARKYHSVPRSDLPSRHLTPDMRSTRNSCVYLTHSLRQSQRLPPPRSRYHTSTLLKNLPGAKPRLQQPAAPRPDARVWTLSYPRHQRTEILQRTVCVRPAPRYRHTHTTCDGGWWS